MPDARTDMRGDGVKKSGAFDPDKASIEELAEYVRQHWFDTAQILGNDLQLLIDWSRVAPEKAAAVLVLATPLSGYLKVSAPRALELVQGYSAEWAMQGSFGRRKKEAELRVELKKLLADSQMAREDLRKARRALGFEA